MLTRKSYDFVEFAGQIKPFKEKGYISGRINLNIHTLSPLYIGSGYEDSKDGMLYKTFLRYRGVPVIPGSTVKGVVRTISEAVSYSCIDVAKNGEKLPFENKKKCDCIACKTFGRMGYKGRISFSDFILEKGDIEIIKVAKLMSPQIKKGSMYYKGDKYRGIKFYRHGDYNALEAGEIPLETVLEKSVFKGQIIFHDVHEKQIELICYSLGLDESFYPMIGGNKPGYFGSCRFEIDTYEFSKEGIEPLISAKKYGVEDKVLEKNKSKLSEILSIRN